MNKKCEELIDERLKGAMQDIENALRGTHYTCQDCGLEWYGEGEDTCPECDSDYLEERPSLEKYEENMLDIAPVSIKVRMGLSWSGPADGFYVYLDPEDLMVDRIEYYYQQWFDGATRQLWGEELEMAERLLGEMARWAVENLRS